MNIMSFSVFPPPLPSPRGHPQHRVSIGQTRSSSVQSCESIQTSSSTEEYCKKVAREAAMDIDIPAHSPSWADQMDLEGEIPPLDQIDLVDALPTQEQIELEYTQPATPPVVHEASRPSPPPPVTGNVLMEITPAAIPYDANSSVDPDLWDGQLQALSIFGTQEAFDRDAAHITLSLERAATYIRQTDLDNGDPNTLPQLNSFGTTAWNFISAIYQSKWDHLLTSDNIVVDVPQILFLIGFIHVFRVVFFHWLSKQIIFATRIVLPSVLFLSG